MNLEIMYERKSGKKPHKHMETKQQVTQQAMDQWRNQRRNFKISCDKWKWKPKFPKSMGCSKSSSKREVRNNKSLPQKIRKVSNKQSKCTLKWTIKRRTAKTKVSRRKKIISREEKIEIKTKKNRKDPWN